MRGRSSMKRLHLIVKSSSLLDFILINGENIRFRRNKDSKRIYEADIDTDKDELKLSLDTFNPYLQSGWWIKMMFLFIISIFGIFDKRFRQRYIYRCGFTLHLTQDSNELTIIPCGKMDHVLDFQGNVKVDEIENRLEIDPRVKKRKVGMFFSKFGFILIVIAIVVLILVSTIK